MNGLPLSIYLYARKHFRVLSKTTEKLLKEFRHMSRCEEHKIHFCNPLKVKVALKSLSILSTLSCRPQSNFQTVVKF